MSGGSIAGEVGAVGGTLRGYGAPVPLPGYMPRLLAAGPVVAYDFAETEGTSFADASGNGRTGNLTNAQTAVLGLEGPDGLAAVKLSDGVAVRASGLVLNTVTKTFVGWFKIDRNYGDAQTLFGLNQGEGVYDSMLVVGDDGMFVANAYTGSTQSRATSFRYVPGQWHFAVMVFDGPEWSIHVDGWRIGKWTVGDSYAAYTAPNVEVNPTAWVAAGEASYAGFAAFDRALTREEIIGLYGRDPYEPSEYAEIVMADGPSMFWPMDDPEGQRAVRDLSESSVFGEYVGTVSRVTGPDGRGAVETSPTSWVAVGHVGSSTAPRPPAPCSIEVWFKRVQVDDRYMPLFALGTGHLDMGILPNGQPRLIRAAVVELIIGSGDLRDTNDWHHAVGVVESPNVGKLYVDGALVGTLASNHFADIGSTWPIAVGNGYMNSPEWGRTTQYAYAAVYPYALSAEQVAAHYAAIAG